MEYTLSLQQTNSHFIEMILYDAMLSKAAYMIISCICLVLFFVSLYKKAKRRWDSVYFKLICACIFAWSLCSLFVVFAMQGSNTDTPELLRNLFIIPIPAFLCLHIRRQVSYKEQRTDTAIALFAIPAVLALMICRDLFIPGSIRALPAIGEAKWCRIVFYVYAGIALIRSYLLCFSVFYQMPRHTRRSTGYKLVSVSAVAFLIILEALADARILGAAPQSEILEALLPLGPPIAFCFLLFPLYNALHVMPASDVIVTSREFVMGGLNTTVLILNQKQQLLDWNRKVWGDGFPLPKPFFMEPFDDYKERILDGGSCRVSPYNENIIISENDGAETHYLLRTHEAKSTKRAFGFVLEISEITPIYTLLRQFEELAHYDRLTNMYNRNAYLALVTNIIKEENMPLLIFVGDVNQLKQVNDVHGHIVGDQLIITIADIIKKAMPPGAFAARVGGDEFVMLLPGGSVELAEQFVHDVIDMCGEVRHEVFGLPSISWGYSVMASVERSYNEVFDEADKIMYEYKKARHQFRSSGLLPG